jgi:hypothetical protein
MNGGAGMNSVLDNGYAMAGGAGSGVMYADGGAAVGDGGVALTGGHFGCGINGCGTGGRLCGHCRARLGHPLGHGGHGGFFNGPNNPYGSIPHTPALDPYGMYGGGMGGGGPVPAYQYPYYTTRGPRDFLLDACGPAPVGPYNPCKPCLPTIGW